MHQDKKTSYITRFLWFISGFVSGALILLIVLIAFGGDLSEQEDNQQQNGLVASDPYHLLSSCEAKDEAFSPSEATAGPMSDEAVLSWAESTPPKLFDFDFQTVKERVLAEKPNFTAAGWCSFVQAMTEARLFDALKDRHLALSLNKLGPARLLNKETQNPKTHWDVQIPVSLNFKALDPAKANPPEAIQGNLYLSIEAIGSKPAISQLVLTPGL